MRASDGKGRCQEAAQYYYDLLQHDDAAVPRQVRGHVESCSFCREQIRRLGEALPAGQQEAGSPAASTEEETVEALAAHLELVEERMTCSRIRFSLPDLVGLSSQIKVPTPVTVHVDHCPRCAEDLATIRALDLRAGQLERLSRVFGESSGRSLMECREAQPAVALLGSFSLEDIDTRILNHISTCPQCRISVYRYRERFLAAEPREASGAIPCNRIATADLFDLVVPYGIEPAGQGRRRRILAHVRGCPECVERIQMLHRTLYGIAERADSGISTVYTPRDSLERVGEPAGAAPPRYPVHVQVLHSGPEPEPSHHDVSAARPAGQERRSIRASRLSFAKIAFATAGAFLVVSLLFTNAPTVSGTSIGEVCRALRRESNVHVLTYHSSEAVLLGEIWVARDLNVLVRRNNRSSVLFDLNRRCQKTFDPDRETYTTVPMTDLELEGTRRIAANCGGILFAGISADARLEETESELSGPAGSKVAVYELHQTTVGYREGLPSSCRSRIFIDRASRLPLRLEYLQQKSPETDWTVIKVQVVEYPGADEMRDAIKAMFPE